MLRIAGLYAHPASDGRSAPVGLSITREDGVRLVADLSINEAATLIRELAEAMSVVSTFEATKPVIACPACMEQVYQGQMSRHLSKDHAVGSRPNREYPHGHGGGDCMCYEDNCAACSTAISTGTDICMDCAQKVAAL